MCVCVCERLHVSAKDILKQLAYFIVYERAALQLESRRHFHAPGSSPLGCSIKRDLFGPRWWWEGGKRRGGEGGGGGAPAKTIISAA